MKKDESFSDANEEQKAFRIAELIAGFIKETLTPTEHQELDDWVTASMANQRLFEELTNPEILEAKKAELKKARQDESLKQIKSKLDFAEPANPSLIKRIRPYLAAACLLTGIILLWTKVQNKNPQVDKTLGVQAVNDLPPGGNKATLTLADGTTMQLNGSTKGKLATQGGTLVMKDDSNRLMYETGVSTSKSNPVFNVLRVPRGGQFQVRLPDGTNVWLNAESYLKYPTVFTGKNREVELSGEGYFEVARDPQLPFVVLAENVETRVLGTSFDISTYPEKKVIQITLAKGAVTVLSAGSSEKGRVLLPGQQAQVNRLGGGLKVVPANLVTTLAWKDGLFTFENTPLEDVLAQISRWYNVNTTDSTTAPNHFNATIARDVPVSKLVHMLEQTKQVHFRIESDKITATN